MTGASHRLQTGQQRILTGGRICLCAAFLVGIGGLDGVSYSQVHYNPKAPMKGPMPSRNSSGGGGSNGGSSPDQLVNFMPDPNQKIYEALNQLRHKEMASDAARLVQLANELKAQADKGGKETRSAESVQKAQLIEKLAKSVREKMTATVGN
jgi:hypothetical protein